MANAVQQPKKKLKDDAYELRDMLLDLMFGISPVTQTQRVTWTYSRIARPTRRNYQRDRELRKGIFTISYNGIKLGIIQKRPHKSLVLQKFYNNPTGRLYSNVLEQVARDYIPGITIERRTYV